MFLVFLDDACSFQQFQTASDVSGNFDVFWKRSEFVLSCFHV